MNVKAILIAAVTVCAHAQTPGPIAYTHAPDGHAPLPEQDIYVVREGDSKPRALTSDGHSHNPVWSPDGKRILFIHDSTLSTPPPYRETEENKSYHSVELSVMDSDGHNRRVLRVIEPVIFSAAWSPNGKTLAISLAKPGPPGERAKFGLYLLPSNAAGEPRLIKTDAWTPSWSPDGKKLVFTIEDPIGHWAIHTANADGTNDKRLTDPSVMSGSPSWSPDVKQLASDQFVDNGTRSQIFLMNADGSGMRQLTNDSAWSCSHPAWTADGRQLIAACSSASTPCGRGFFSTGQRMPECTRRLFAIPAIPGSQEKPVQITDHDGSQPATPGRTPLPSSRSVLQAAAPGQARTKEP